MKYGLLGVILASYLLVGCGSQPIPRVAVAGTTITIALPASLPVGFGTALVGTDGLRGANPAGTATHLPFDPNSPLEDAQRGEVSFDLYDAAGVRLVSLPVRVITRVNGEELSPRGISGRQSIALLDIPEDIQGGEYSIRLRHWRRSISLDQGDRFGEIDPPEVNDPDEGVIPWRGWFPDPNDAASPPGATFAKEIPIRIVDKETFQGGTSNFTPRWGTDLIDPDLHTDALEEELRSTIPYPRFSVLVTPSGENPAAWEAQLTYPRTQVAIRGVGTNSPRPSTAFVSWSVEPEEPPGGVACDDPTPEGTLTIRMIDPTLQTSGVYIAFELRNVFDCALLEATPDDFVTVANSLKVYDLAGELMEPAGMLKGEIR